jgi:ribonuclease HI
VGLTNLGSESETCVGSRVRLVEVPISFEKNFYRLPFTPASLVRRIGPSEIRCDGAWERKGAGIAAIITSSAGIKLRYAARLDYKDPSDRCTNNTTEYEALLLGLRKVRALGASNFLVKCDAKVIKDHVEKESEAREPELVKYLTEVRKMERHFRGFTIEHLSRKNNGEADELAKKAARGEAMPPDVFFEILTAPSTRPDKQPLVTP